MRIELCAFADEAADELEGQIAALKRNGIDKIELRNLGGVNVRDLSETAAKEAAARLREAGISVWSLGSPLGKTAVDDPAEEERLARLLRLCEIFGCDKIRVFSYFTTRPDEIARAVVLRLRRLAAQAAAAGVTLCHENEKDIFGDRAERVAYLLDQVEGLESVYDPANYLQVGESAEEMRRMIPRAAYYHIKDVLPSGELVPAGEGAGNISGLISSLRKDTVLTVEPHLAVFSGYAAIDTHEMKNKYSFPSRDAAFGAAVKALKGLLRQNGYLEKDRAWVKE